MRVQIIDERLDGIPPHEKATPTNATGVPVMLKAMSSDGTVLDITTVTSDLKVHFEDTWTPTNADTYEVMASFNRDD